MPSPYQDSTAAATTGLAYTSNRKLETLCDGSLLSLVQTATATLSLIQITNPSTTPTFTTLTQTFTVAGSTNTIGDMYVVNNGTATSDVWLVYGFNSASQSVFVAHATYTPGTGWNWDNTGTAAVTGASNPVVSIVWTGTYLIIAFRTGAYYVALSYTTVKNGSSTWSTAAQLSTTSTGSHQYPILMHDGTISATVIVYSQGGDSLYARVLGDNLSPLVANWSAALTLTSGTLSIGADNIAAAIDQAAQRVHVAFMNASSSSANNPQYVWATYTTASVTAGISSFGAGTAALTAAAVDIGLASNATPATAYLFWGTGAVGSVSDINYRAVTSPYSSSTLGAVVNLTQNSANDNAYPHLLKLTKMSGYIPVLYAHAVSPWAVEYDNSIALAAGGNTYSQTLTDTQSALDAQVFQNTVPLIDTQSGVDYRVSQAIRPLSPDYQSGLDSPATLIGHVYSQTLTDKQSGLDLVTTQWVHGWLQYLTDAQSAQDGQTKRLSKPLSEATSGVDAWSNRTTRWYLDAYSQTDTLSETKTAGGVGVNIGTIIVSTKSQTWALAPGAPGPTTETDIIYLDSGSAGWAFGMMPGYGGNTVASLYQLDNGTYSVNQTSLSTTTPDGHVHWLDQSPTAVWGGSEDGTWTMTELGPVGTSFRRYYKGVSGPDANGFTWNVYTCFYPGNPGFAVYRFDCINTSTSAISLATSDSLEIALIGGMQQTDTTWQYTNGGYGQITWANATTWPVASVSGNPVATDIDYTYITPTTNMSVTMGQFTIKQKAVTAFSPAWASPQISVLANTARMKFKIQGNLSSFPGSTTSTVYLLNGVYRGLTGAIAKAIAADYISPGTPTGGQYVSYSYDERAYVFNAGHGTVTTTLDLSPANVSVRYKPILKVTGWGSATPTVLWGGVMLVAGSDYQYYFDTPNGTLYVQLYFDIVASGAGAGQRNNAQLLVTSNAYTYTQLDMESATDLSWRNASKALAEGASATDATAKSALKPAIDALSGVDSSQKAAQKGLSDAQSGLDGLTKAATRLQIDSTSALDALSHTWSAHLALLEAISGLDSVQKTLLRAILDPQSALDSLSWSKVTGGIYSQLITERISQLDVVLTTKILGAFIVDALSGRDSRTSATTAPLSDAQSAIDAWMNRMSRPLGDAQAGLDSRLSQMSRPLGDATAAQESRSFQTIAPLYDGTSGTDALLRQVTRLLLDAGTLSESQLHQVLKAVQDLTSQVDVLTAGKVFLVSLLDAAGLLDTPLTSYTRAKHGKMRLLTSLVSSTLGINLTLSTTPHLGMKVSLLSSATAPTGLAMAFSFAY